MRKIGLRWRAEIRDKKIKKRMEIWEERDERNRQEEERTENREDIEELSWSSYRTEKEKRTGIRSILHHGIRSNPHL